MRLFSFVLMHGKWRWRRRQPQQVARGSSHAGCQRKAIWQLLRNQRHVQKRTAEWRRWMGWMC